ncbi:Deoxycytidylate deaminase [Colletotrichum tanaceti]|uniref:Deoxycytidylate deaminase n=1 Tax=Colletotrichum tanaceti TaxID=1306861 RepID=A0A4U6X741_9PEZI|nr:Deoxycytidylate deaminase [Colletotrichum tanaceti]KAJ0165838.1 Deoxycytidylate deaminase [Colletotrichum tanaceti]TKW51301.1 Deoxycytidylate deaminase [Colletotrichum tanaceti]
MLIGICGGICSGKKTVAQYLVEHHGFKLLRLEDPSSPPPRDESPAYTAYTETPAYGEPPVSQSRPPPPESTPRSPAPEPAPSTVGHDDWDAQPQPPPFQPFKKKYKKKKTAGLHCFVCRQQGHIKAECPLRGAQDRTVVAVNGNGNGNDNGKGNSKGNSSRDDESPSREFTPPMFVSAYAMVTRPSHTPPQAPHGFHVPAPSQVTSSESLQQQQQQQQQQQHHLTFASAEALVDFVTTRWQSLFVTTDVHNEAVLDTLSRRPFFLLVSVDGPLTVRHARFRALHNPHCTLESFARASDNHLYDPDHGMQALISRATVRLLNTSSSLAHLYATLGKLQLADPVRLRPGWDAYFMSLAELASLRSNCMKRRVGAVLVGREKRVISTGYNGTPRGLRNCSDGGCARCNSGNASGVGLATCLCIHAEENALLEAGRERIREGAVIYCDTCPCLTCSIKICQVGIEEVVYAHGYSMDSETAAVFAQAGVKLRQYIPAPNGLIHLENLESLELY